MIEFDLERAVSEWRRQMLAADIKTPAPLDELESHLREDIRARLPAGLSPAEAFQLAVSRLGSPGPLRTEFDKLRRARWWPVTLACWLFAIASALTAAFISKRLWEGKLSPLLYVHVVTVTVGYGAGFLAGGFGILYVCHRLFRGLPPERQQSLNRAVLWCSRLSAGLVIAGSALAIFWCHQHFGKYVMGDAKEIGAAVVAVWFVVLSVRRPGRQISERAAMLMCVGGNIIVSLAWFGAAIVERKPAAVVHAWEGAMPLALSVFLGLNLVFLVLGLAPAPSETGRPA